VSGQHSRDGHECPLVEEAVMETVSKIDSLSPWEEGLVDDQSIHHRTYEDYVRRDARVRFGASCM
jgi:hypothetical protein